MVGSPLHFNQGVSVPEVEFSMGLAFVGAVSPDFCAIQRVSGDAAQALPDGTIETQDADGLWYPCTYNSFSSFLQQIYFNRTMTINDFSVGTPWRINPLIMSATPSSGTMV